LFGASALYVASTAFAEDKEQKNDEEQNDLDFFLADEDDEKKADEANEGEKDKKKKKKKKKNKNKKKKSKRDSEEETVSKDAVESEEPNPADIAEDKREDEEINGVLRYKYLIVGGGTASYAAVKAIRDADPEAEILLVTSDERPPYQRPPLSKELWWTEDANVAQNLKFTDWMGNATHVEYKHLSDYAADSKIRLVLGQNVKDMDAYRKAALLDDGRIIFFEKCLLATGGEPRQLPGAPKHSHITTFRSVRDFQELDAVTRDPTVKHITVVGGGFLGTEITAALNSRAKKGGFKVAQLFPEPGIMSLNVPAYLSDYATSKLRQDGVDVHTGVVIKNFEVNNQKALTSDQSSSSDDQGHQSSSSNFILTLSNDQKLQTDHVVVAIGIKPNTQLAESAGLEIDKNNGGIVVNQELAARSDLYVAGDVLSYYDPILGRRRVEHYDHADNSGRHAAMNMTGARKAYNYMPMFWGAMNGTPYEAVGLIDSKLDTVGVWQKGEDENGSENEEQGEYKKGVVYYMKNKKIVGVLLWNLFNRVDDARRAIRIGREFDDTEKLQRVITIDDKAKEEEDRRMKELNDRDTQQAKGVKVEN
jgi:programmed cell death 8 (apoptosis-inducing factor)